MADEPKKDLFVTQDIALKYNEEYRLHEDDWKVLPKGAEVVTLEEAVELMKQATPEESRVDQFGTATGKTPGDYAKLSKEEFLNLSQKAGQKHDQLLAAFVPMKLDYALFVRDQRVNLKGSWRMVAASCAEEWGESWGSNQIFGMALCQAAAQACGEDWQKAPWN